MADLGRDDVHNYRPGPQSERSLEEGESVIAVFSADRRRYWMDHAAMAVIGSVAVSALLPFFGNADQIPIAVLAIFLGIAARGAYFASEAFARRWRMTERRLIGPQGQSVTLLGIETVRRLFGDVQIVTKSGAKHLIRHLGEGQAVVDQIEKARTRRAMAAA